MNIFLSGCPSGKLLSIIVKKEWPIFVLNDKSNGGRGGGIKPGYLAFSLSVFLLCSLWVVFVSLLVFEATVLQCFLVDWDGFFEDAFIG